MRLRVTTALAGDLREGDSIAVNGVCLTAVGADGDGFGADVMHETLRRSSLAEVAPGARVNLELPLRGRRRASAATSSRATSTALGAVRAVREEGFARVVTIAADPACCATSSRRARSRSTACRSPSRAVDGDAFAVSLIPETLERTTLGAAGPGAPVNLEVDILAKYVEKLLPSCPRSP